MRQLIPNTTSSHPGPNIPRWRNHNSSHMVLLHRLLQPQQLLHNWDQKRQRLPTARNSLHHHILMRHKQRNSRCLHRRHPREAHGRNGVESPLRQRRVHALPRPRRRSRRRLRGHCILQPVPFPAQIFSLAWSPALLQNQKKKRKCLSQKPRLDNVCT